MHTYNTFRSRPQQASGPSGTDRLNIELQAQESTKTLCDSGAAADSILLLSLIQPRQWAWNNQTTEVDPSETDSHTVMLRGHHSGGLPHNSRPSTGHGTLSSPDEPAAREGTGGVHAPHCYRANLYNRGNSM